jgi:hypothetical protein
MKWIKLYEDFDSVNTIIDNLKDICFELNDDGIRTECKHNVPSKKYAPLPGQREHISVGLEETYITGDLPFVDYIEELTFGKIQNVVFRILDYMKSCGWKPSYVIVDGESYHIEKNTESAMLWLSNHFKLESVLRGLQIDFIRE